MPNLHNEAVRLMIEEDWEPREVVSWLCLGISTVKKLKALAQRRGYCPDPPAVDLPEWLEPYNGGEHLDRRQAA